MLGGGGGVVRGVAHADSRSAFSTHDLFMAFCFPVRADSVRGVARTRLATDDLRGRCRSASACLFGWSDPKPALLSDPAEGAAGLSPQSLIVEIADERLALAVEACRRFGHLLAVR